MPGKNNEQRSKLESSSYTELMLLEEVEHTPQVTQRHLAHQLGVALGVTNVVVRNLARKGYVRATRVGWNRWIYVLTPAGIARKLSLALGYVDRFLDHYRRVRTLLRDDLETLTLNAESRIAVYGATELAELAYLALRDLGITKIDIFEMEGAGRRFLGMPVQNLEALVPEHYVKVLVAYSTDVEARSEELYAKMVEDSQVVTLLQSSKDRAGTADQGEVAN